MPDNQSWQLITSLKEWRLKVPQKWWDVVNALWTASPLIVGIVFVALKVSVRALKESLLDVGIARL